MASDSFSVKIVFLDEEPSDVRSALEEAGAADVRPMEQRGLTGLEIVYLAVLAATGLILLIERTMRMWKCGVVVDARGTRVLVEKSCDLPRGTVLVISPDGVETKLIEPTSKQLNDYLKSIGAMKG
jgi:hypothetical protein